MGVAAAQQDGPIRSGQGSGDGVEQSPTLDCLFREVSSVERSQLGQQAGERPTQIVAELPQPGCDAR